MKKLTLLSAVVLGIAFTSCKKDYTCTCTDVTPGTTGATPSVRVLKGVSKKQAAANCFSTETKVSGTVVDAEKCELSK